MYLKKNNTFIFIDNHTCCYLAKSQLGVSGSEWWLREEPHLPSRTMQHNHSSDSSTIQSSTQPPDQPHLQLPSNPGDQEKASGEDVTLEVTQPGQESMPADSQMKNGKKASGNSLAQQCRQFLGWMPPWCRWDPESPPKFTMSLNLLFGFVCLLHHLYLSQLSCFGSFFSTLLFSQS